MAKPQPDIPSNSLTLLFKHGKTTVFVFAVELSPISKVKQDLLNILHEIYPKGLAPRPASSRFENIPIPDSPNDVLLAVPKNINNISDGWVEIDTTSEDGANETVRGLGLREASMLAFLLERDVKKPVFWAEFSNVDELYPDDEES